MRSAKSFFTSIDKMLNSFYFFEDIIPLLKISFKSIKAGCGVCLLKTNEFRLFVSYYIKYHQQHKQRMNSSDGIKIEKYAYVCRMLHEAKYGIKNTDYNALVIDWILLAKTQKIKTDRRPIRFSNKIKSLKSTYSYELNQRIIY
ncbi:MAG: hypothetical protein AABY22_05765 [Nanoarchaeota archaeon]